MRISNRMQDEYSVLLMALTTGRDAELASTRAYIEWAVAHSEALL